MRVDYFYKPISKYISYLIFNLDYVLFINLVSLTLRDGKLNFSYISRVLALVRVSISSAQG